MLVDTHCHLDFDAFAGDRDEAIGRALSEGVGAIINVGTSVEGSLSSLELAASHKEIFASAGIHPHDASGVTPSDIKKIDELSASAKVVAIGEIGLDYYRNLSPKGAQEKIFASLLDLASSRRLPVIVHSREAGKDTLRILKERLSPPIKGVMHCFAGDERYLEEVLELGLYISFTCNLTFKKADNLRALAKRAPIERILLETDAPFLAPEAYRGKRNEPAYLRHLRDILAEIKGLSAEDIERITTLNAESLFGLGIKEGVGVGKIAYKIRDSLYINLTNRCTGGCTFCIRCFTDYVKGHNLKIDKDPEVSDIRDAIKMESGYKEVVFCGYGEPLMRLDAVKDISKMLKRDGKYIRIDTNGHGNLIHKRSIVGELVGLVDEVSVSLNADNEDSYNNICKPAFGPGTFDKVKEFIAECRDKLPKVAVTFVDMPGVDMARCRLLAGELKVGFRVRKLHEVG
ncbi:MAG: hypothetical protein AUJ75_03775 [Candidatus Omnitrophica bacterium CG1_02_49_10]|nr:MAG: hypothetical protein AUJ75_03775 [Candidatus Omnitrophica bacterium CG1_02_49_10]